MAQHHKKQISTERMDSNQKKQGAKTQPANRPVTQTAKPAAKPNANFGTASQTKK